jgi:hypothetical protein
MAPSGTGLLYMLVLGGPYVGLLACGLYLKWCGYALYHRIGNYSFGVNTFFWQLAQPGLNFPGPNVLEAVIDKLPPELKANVLDHRRRGRLFGRVFLSYLGFSVLFVLAVSIGRKLSS